MIAVEIGPGTRVF